MSWNEPGGSGNRNPWGRGGDSPPPDLDELFRRLQRRLGGLGGGRGGKDGAGASGPLGGAGALVAVVVGIWLAFGFYIVREGEQAVVLRFGAYHATTGPGLHWRIPPPVDRTEIVDMGRIRDTEIGGRRNGQGVTQAGESLMLTADENIVDVKFAIQYRVTDARAYLFNLVDPDATLHGVTESALREVIGQNRMEFILTQGRDAVARKVEELVQNTLDAYGTGLTVTSVNMQDAQPPEQVQAAFFDAIQAREDEQRLINEAETYRNEVLPRARGAAARVVAEAEAFGERAVARARGDADRFGAVLAEYRRAPDVTRDRLYLETLETVLAGSRKVIVDHSGDGQNLYYLPLDRLLQGGGGQGSAAGDSTKAKPAEGATLPDALRLPRERAEPARGRESRL